MLQNREVKQKQIWNMNVAETVMKIMILTLQRLQCFPLTQKVMV